MSLQIPQGALSSAQNDIRDSASTSLKPNQIAFLEALAGPAELREYDQFSPDDRLFVVGVGKQMEAQKLDLPMLPEASLRLAEMLRKGDRPMAVYAELIAKDASLAVQVLKAANSALFGGMRKTTSLPDAVVRVGLVRLQSILLLTLMKTRVVKAGPLQELGELLIELSQPLAAVVSLHALARRVSPDACYVKGMLLHAEHLVILGLVPVIGREHRTPLNVSAPAFQQVFLRFGPEIRQRLASLWNLGGILGGEAGEQALYEGVRNAIIRRWLGQSLPFVQAIDPELLESVLRDVHLRVDPVFGETSDDGSGVNQEQEMNALLKQLSLRSGEQR